MSLKSTSMTVIFTLLLILAGFNHDVIQQQHPTRHNLTIKKINGVWKVVGAGDNTNIIVERGDKITWQAPDNSDVMFQFPTGVGKYFEADSSDDSLTDGYYKRIMQNGKLKFKVKRNAPPDTVEYAVFVIRAGQYARGDSPPHIIIH